MTGMVEKKSLILLACRTPRRFTELMREAKVSRAWLAEALKELVEEGLLEKLPDGRYVLTERGKELAEAAEIEALTRWGIQRGLAEVLKIELKKLLAAEAAIKVLRAWAMATATWRLVCRPDAKASDEEKRAVAASEIYLELLGGETWWKRYSLLLPSGVAARMDAIHGAGRKPIIALAATRENVARQVEELLASLPPEAFEILEEQVRPHLLLLARLAEERVKELKEKATLEKLGKAIQAAIMVFGVKREKGDEEAGNLTLLFERELEKYLS
jgi:DNA-binding HxlR family transcriptional regulator